LPTAAPASAPIPAAEQHVLAFSADQCARDRTTDCTDGGTLGGLAVFRLTRVGVGGLATGHRHQQGAAADNTQLSDTLVPIQCAHFRLP